ncbi:MAG: peptidoglycan DD-metalloendopeptidase family protein [Candidatus Krumholzibacteriota bacterium]|nr:peptidoglycan DD-metalloendopeptidase family protein [Candidatus Krumholzibacteriota bacterium]
MRHDRHIQVFLLAAALAAIAIGLAIDRPGILTEPAVAPAGDPVPASVDAAIPGKACPVPTLAGRVDRNGSFFDIVSACGIEPAEIYAAARSAKQVYDFRRIYPGQRYEVYADSARIDSVFFSISEEEYVSLVRTGDGYEAERRSYPFDVVTRTCSGLITQSLFASFQEQGLPIELGLQLVDILAWDIDFFSDIRKNDYFRVIYEEKTRSDGLQRIGRILAVEFNTQGTSHYAFLFENEDGLADYFDDTGRSLRKQLLRAPLSYTRISSNFSSRRLHPVLHHYRPHYGIDYAAPEGTPVMTTGDGTVLAASRTRANGNYVKIRHNNGYITYYLHLSRFGSGIRGGVKVRQGQVIGYVGHTGYATGPHLDYRVKIGNRFVNPRRLKLPPAKPVSEEKMPAFAELRDGRITELCTIPIRDSRTVMYAATPEHDSPTEGYRPPLEERTAGAASQ